MKEINPATGMPKLILNKSQWEMFKKTFNLSEEDMKLQYILDKKSEQSTKTR